MLTSHFGIQLSERQQLVTLLKVADRGTGAVDLGSFTDFLSVRMQLPLWFGLVWVGLGWFGLVCACVLPSPDARAATRNRTCRRLMPWRIWLVGDCEP